MKSSITKMIAANLVKISGGQVPTVACAGLSDHNQRYTPHFSAVEKFVKLKETMIIRSRPEMPPNAPVAWD
jgi:hypothetical protein